MKTILKISTLLFLLQLAISTGISASTAIPHKTDAGAYAARSEKPNTIWNALAQPFAGLRFRMEQATESQPAEDGAKMDGLAIAGFVCGIISLFVFGIILGPLAVIFSALALKRIKRSEGARKGRGLAIAGLILGIVGIVGWFIAVLILYGG